MSNHPVIKIAKPGKSLTSTDPRDFILHSDFTMFKLDSIASGSIAINSGATSGYVDIVHNLGKRAFLVYQDGQLFPRDIVAYNDGTKIRIIRTLDSPYNQSVTEYHPHKAAFEDSTDSFEVIAGKKLSSGDGSALRFANIYINQGQTVNSASFEYRHVVTTSGANVKFKIYGVDMDAVEDYGDYGYYASRPLTDTVNIKEQSPITSDFNFGDNWTNIVQEIVNRGGWSSGNPMAFVFQDNGSPDQKCLVKQKADSSVFLPDISLNVTLTGTGYLTSNYKVVIFKDKIA